MIHKRVRLFRVGGRRKVGSFRTRLFAPLAIWRSDRQPYWRALWHSANLRSGPCPAAVMLDSWCCPVNVLLTREFRAAQRRHASGGSQWNEPSGYLFGEKVCLFLSSRVSVVRPKVERELTFPSRIDSHARQERSERRRTGKTLCTTAFSAASQYSLGSWRSSPIPGQFSHFRYRKASSFSFIFRRLEADNCAYFFTLLSIQHRILGLC
jgi:hypothetical protein